MRLILFFLFFLPSFLRADLSSFFLKQKNESFVPANEVIQGNYYHMGDAAQISGIVQGSAYLVGTQVVIDGEIKGDLFVVGGSVVLSGKVEGTVTLFTLQATVSGEVGGKVRVFCVNSQFTEDSHLNSSLFLTNGFGEIQGDVDGNVIALAGGLNIAGLLKHNLQTFVGRLKIESTARILGEVKYRSNNDAEIVPGAKIVGAIHYHPSLFRDFAEMSTINGVVLGSKIATFLMNFLYTFVVGAVFIYFFPQKLHRTLLLLRREPFRALFCGCMLLIILPILSLILLISVVGTPLALTLMALNVIGFYTVKIFPILWASNAVFTWLGWKPNKLHTLALGQLVYYFLCLIPIIGWLISLFCMLFGFGASIAAQIKKG